MVKLSLNPNSVPAAVADQARSIGRAVARARTRRRWSQALLAQKAGVSIDVLRAIEHGRLGTAVGSVIAVLWALRLTSPLNELADPAFDAEGVRLTEAREARRRVRPIRRPSLDLDF
jgi:transcriptional regulator with XRE-family HTH domain